MSKKKDKLNAISADNYKRIRVVGDISPNNYKEMKEKMVEYGIHNESTFVSQAIVYFTQYHK